MSGAADFRHTANPTAPPGFAPPPPLRVEVVSSFDAFLELEDEWNDLLDRSEIAHPFLTHEWIRSWWEAFGAEARFNLLVARSGSAPAAIAPFMLTRKRMYGMKVSSLEFAANPHTPRSGIMTSRGMPAARRAILEHLLARDEDWDVLTLSQMPVEPEIIGEIEHLCSERRLLCGIWPASRSPYVETTGEWGSYEGALRRKLRSSLRSRLSRLESVGPVRLETVTGGRELPGALEEGLRIEAAAWKGAAGSAILSEPRSALFYRNLAERFARRGGLMLNFLSVGGRRVAFHYSLLHGRKLFLLKPGYDPAYSAYSPGSLLVHLTLRDAFARGIEEFDLAGDSDDWKMQWTDRTRPHAWLFIFAPRLRARLIHGAKFRLAPWLRRVDLAAVIRDPLGSTRDQREPCA